MLPLLIALVAAPSYAQSSVEEIEQALIAQWDKLQSFSGAYDLTASFKVNPEQTAPMNLVGGGTVDYVKVGGVPRYKGFLWAGFSPTGRLLQAQALYDGQAGYYEALAPLFKLNESGQATMADVIPPGGKALFDAMHKNLANIAALPAEQVNGQDCYVLQAAAKDPKSPVAGLKAWFSKASGIVQKVTLMDASGTQMALIAMKDLKLNGEIAADTFKFVSLAPPAPPAPPAAPAPAPAPAPPATK
jgi:outer membrane lipoprotein-sorting protein